MAKKLRAEDLPYRPCVGIVVFNQEGMVWSGHRIAEKGTEYANSPFRWQMPQGGIDKDEDPKTASLRELHEETGITSVRFLAETKDWLTYDLPDDLIGIGLKGKFRGQKQKWFAYKFEGDESEIQINPPPLGEKAEFDAWEWKKLEQMPDLIVSFKKDIYKQIAAEFKHFGGIT